MLSTLPGEAVPAPPMPWSAEEVFSLAVGSQVNQEKPHQGATGKNAGLHRGAMACNSTTALGVSWGQSSRTAPGARVTYDYDAFGNEVNSTGTTSNNYLYRGEQYDPDLGLYYLRARYYNPLTGRFMSRDPYEPALRNPNGTPINPRELHKYLYTGGDPVNWIDPRGMDDLEEYSYEKDEYTLFQKVAATVALIGIEAVFTLETAELSGMLDGPPGGYPPHPAPGTCPTCGEPGLPPSGAPYPPGQKPPITPDPGTWPEEW